jgi:Fe-S oxidoreductase
MAGRIPREELWTKDMYEVMDLCLGCKACKTECPSSVDMARIKVEYLQAYNDHNGISLFTRLMGLMPGALRLLSSQAGWLFPALNAMARSPLGRWGMRRLGMHPERSFPAFRQASLEHAPNAQSLAGSKARAVTLWVDTWSRFFQPEVAKAAGNVLAKLGYDVEILYDTGCCGRPLITGGQLRKARAEADQLCRELMEPIGRGRTIVGLEPSCILTLRDEFPDLATDRGLATTVASNSRTLEEFLAEAEVEPLDLDASSKNVWLHNHCHQRALVPGNPTADLLNSLGFNTHVIPSGCCGMAGEFGYLDHHYEVSQAVGEDRLFPAIREMPANGSLVASGFSCREQISHFTDRRALHLAEFLDRSIGAQRPVQPE